MVPTGQQLQCVGRKGKEGKGKQRKGKEKISTPCGAVYPDEYMK